MCLKGKPDGFLSSCNLRFAARNTSPQWEPLFGAAPWKRHKIAVKICHFDPFHILDVCVSMVVSGSHKRWDR